MDTKESKLQIGYRAYYEGSVEDDNGEVVPEKVNALGLTLEEYQLCKDWYYLHSELHRNDSVRYGCDCGCGGDSMDLDYEDEEDGRIEKEMMIIEEKLGEAPSMYEDF